MRIIVSPSTHTAFNLALEEVYFKHFEEELCLIYRNHPSVVVGKHQNIFREVNLPFCLANKVGYHRRISGGGAVFHDLGNINVSLHATRKTDYKVNYTPLLELISGSLLGFGLSATVGERNDLYLEGLKISGTACHVVRDRTLHHSTLLYDADKYMLSHCLKSNIKVVGRGVASVPAKVTNLKDHLHKPLKNDLFFSEFIVKVSDILGAYIDYPTDREVDLAREMQLGKYALDSWNIDYSPPCEAEFDVNGVRYVAEIENGLVTAIKEAKGSTLNQYLNKPFLELIRQTETPE